MNITRCFSSQMMTALLTWRNPQGSEENWLLGNEPTRIENYWTHCGKVVTTEIALCILATTSLVEVVACGFLEIGSLLLYPILDPSPFQSFFEDYSMSSLTTLGWAVSDALIYNLFYTNVMTRESFVLEAAGDPRQQPFLEHIIRELRDLSEGRNALTVHAGESLERKINLV